MSNDEWVRNFGPKLTRLQAKKCGILGYIFPWETEARLNLVTLYGNGESKDPVSVGRGNFILPEQTMESPDVRFSISSHGGDVPAFRWYSVLFFDADFPISKKLMSMVLWMQANIPFPKDMDPKLSKLSLDLVDIVPVDKGQTFFPYVPVHPGRGKGYSKYVFVLFGHNSIIQTENIMQIDVSKHSDISQFHQSRMIDVEKFIIQNDMQILGYNWFTSCWTKSVSTIHQKYLPQEAKEIVYGTELESDPTLSTQYKFEHV